MHWSFVLRNRGDASASSAPPKDDWFKNGNADPQAIDGHYEVFTPCQVEAVTRGKQCGAFWLWRPPQRSTWPNASHAPPDAQ
jgi:hypothetical protein